MSEIKHTPGPWKADIHDYPIADTGDYGTSFRVLDVHGDTIATCDYTKDEGDETVANLNLLAATTDLLEALQMAEKKLLELEHRVGGSDDEISVEVEILTARAAIAKATGSQS
jgi:hypothetical protein